MNVLIVDDQKLFRDGLVQLLEFTMPDWQLFVAASPQEAEEHIHLSKLDAVICDVSMPNANGIEWVAALRAQNNDVPVMMLSTFGDHELILKAIQSGANGYLLKDVDIEVLVDSVEKLSTGEKVFAPALTHAANNGFDEPAQPFKLLEPLTDRELEVLKCVANGFSNKEIANVLHKSEGTVKNQVTQLLSKLGVRDRTRAVLKAAEMGLLKG